MTRGSPAGSLSKKHFALNSRSPGESSDRKVSRMQMAINWITGKSGNHEDHPSGLQAAM
eukprot:09532.XXX_331969_332205_1 [CDS] Oithona nana genome sequencing.